MISAAGVRAPVWETDLHYRFVLGVSGPSELIVQLEEDDGTVVSTRTWQEGLPPEQFYRSLVQAVREAGSDLGTGLNLPTESVQGLSQMLVEVTQLRSQELAGHRGTLRKIVERRDGWYFTESHIVPVENLNYIIHIERLNEIDWESHLAEVRGIHTGPSAVRFARRLYKK